ncbi:hypothetical protein AMQ83_14330, partial [Paenibacillus riograndensis]
AEKLDVILLRFEDSLGQLFYNRDIQEAIRQGSISTASSAERNSQTERINSELDRWITSVKGVQAVYLVPLKDEFPVSATGTKDNAFMKEIREASWCKQLKEKHQSLWITQGLKQGDTSGAFHFTKSMAD